MVWAALGAAAAKWIGPAIMSGIASGMSSGIGRRVEGAFLKKDQREAPSYIGSPNFGPQYMVAAENRAYATQAAADERAERGRDKADALAEEEYRHHRDFTTRQREATDAYERALQLEERRSANQMALALAQDKLAAQRMQQLWEQEQKAKFLEDPYQFESWWDRMKNSGQDFFLGKGKRLNDRGYTSEDMGRWTTQ